MPFTISKAPPVRGVPRITLSTEGRLNLNGAAYRLLGSPAEVILLYDPDTRAIGVRPAEGNLDYAVPVRHHGAHYRVSAGSLVREFGIDTSHTHIGRGWLEDGMLVMRLNEPATEEAAATSKRPAKGSRAKAKPKPVKDSTSK